MRRQPPRPRHSPPQSHSSPSSSSSEFEFNISISPRKASSSLCPADELFYKGQLLPLQLSPRLSLVRTLCSSSSSEYTSSSSSSAATSAARDSTESSSSTDSTASFPLLHPPPLDCCESSRPSSVTDDEDFFFKPPKNKSSSGGFSLSRFSSVFKKDPKTNLNHHSSSSAAATSATAAPSSVKRMSSTAKEVIRKYMKKVKPLYDKLSQKQSSPVLKTESLSLKDSGNNNIRGTTTTVTAAPTGGGLSISFSGNLMKYTKRGRCAASCPSSMRSSPSHSGVLTRGGFPGHQGGSCSSSSSDNNSMSSSMEELQSAIQGAIAHCKNSMLQKNLWGAAYCVRGGPEKEKLAIEYLERRECEYDSKTLVEFYTETETDTSTPILTGVIVFTSTPDKVSNKYYLGPAPLEEMAKQIATASGPCGNNREYLFKLEKAMHDIEHEEEYVIELANEVRKQLDLPEEVKALLKPVVSHVPVNSQAHVSTRQRVFAS